MSETQRSSLNLTARVKNLSPNPSAEIIKRGRENPDILFLAQGEGDMPTPEFIIKAAEKALHEGKTFYGPPLGYPELRQALSRYYERTHNVNVGENRMFITPSGSKAMNLALTAVLEQGDEVIAVTPIWKNLLSSLELTRATIKEVPLDNNDGHWELDLDALFDACTERTKLLLITTPSNPCGWTMTKEEMQAVLAFARERGIWIISDEVYTRITFDGKPSTSFLEVAKPDDQLLIVNNFSKTWAMTGWRLGWLIGPPAIEDIIRTLAFYDYMAPTSFNQFAAIEALEHGEDFIQEQIDLWQGNRDYMYELFRQNNRIISSPPPSTFYSFFRVDGEPDDLALAYRLLNDHKVAVSPGCAFGAVGKGYIRLCFAVSRPQLEKALDRVMTALQT